MVPEFGKVVFFNKEKNWGRILPDHPTAVEGDRTIFFHQRGGRQIILDGIGGLAFDFDIGISRIPEVGDRVVYLSTDHRKGMIAFEWNFQLEWKRAEMFIALRPWPSCPLCRIVRVQRNPNQTIEKTVLWLGYYPRLMEKLFEGDGCYTQNAEEWYVSVWCEELDFHGYKRMWNPLDRAITCGRPSVIAPDKEEILQQFEVSKGLLAV